MASLRAGVRLVILALALFIAALTIYRVEVPLNQKTEEPVFQFAADPTLDDVSLKEVALPGAPPRVTQSEHPLCIDGIDWSRGDVVAVAAISAAGASSTANLANHRW